MINEILTKCGVDEAKANEIVKAMEEAKIYTTNLENIDVRYNKLKDKVSRLEETNKNYEVQVKQLSKNNTDNEELKKQLEQLQLSNKELQEKHSKELYERDFNYALDKGLSSVKAKDINDIKMFIDIEKLKYQDGKIEGLEEQIKSLEETKSYLFDTEQQQVPPSTGFNPTGTNGGEVGITKEKFKTMNMAQRIKLRNDDPKLYEELSQ